MIDALKASWDHLPKRPRLPPSLFELKSRKLWISVKPTFTYGDERDKIQRDNARKAKKQLARDEAWAMRDKKRKQREKEREQRRKEREAKREESKKVKAAKVAAGAATKSKSKSTLLAATAKVVPRVRMPIRSATAPAPARSKSMPQTHRPRVVVYSVPTPSGAGAKPVAVTQTTRSRTVTQQRPTRQATAPVVRPVQPWGPITTATQRPGMSPVRSNTYPAPATRKR